MKFIFGYAFVFKSYLATSSSTIDFFSYPAIAGGIIQFASKGAAFAKWIINRPFQAKLVDSSVDINGVTKTTSSIREIVENITSCLMKQLLNPFCNEIQKSKLCSLVSGCPMNNNIAESLLNLEEIGKDAMESFEECLVKEAPSTLFFEQQKRNKFNSWNQSS